MVTAHATPTRLAEISVAEAMHPGVLTCPPETRLDVVARMLASYDVHCIVVFEAVAELGEGVLSPFGVISDLDLVGAAITGDLADRTAGGTASAPLVRVGGDETLERAARLMTEHQASHLLVVEPDSRHPVGILSTLDIAAALAGVPVRSGPPRVERV